MVPSDRRGTSFAPMIISSIVEQHAEDVAFLWCLRDAATEQPHYALRDLRNLEERIEAHLDGLRVAGKAGHEFAWGQLDQYRGAGELFSVAVLALEEHNKTHIERILHFAEQVHECRRGLFGAIGWVAANALRGQTVEWFDAPSFFRRLVATVACSLHRVDPGSRIDRLLTDEPIVRARAIRLAGELRRMDLRGQLRRALADEDDACRFWAAWSGGL